MRVFIDVLDVDYDFNYHDLIVADLTAEEIAVIQTALARKRSLRNVDIDFYVPDSPEYEIASFTDVVKQFGLERLIPQ